MHAFDAAPPACARSPRQMSSTWTIGRQGVPSLSIRISFVVQASPQRLLRTTSKRIRGDAPQAVALRRNVGEKPSSASTRDVLLDELLALGVRGLRVERRLLVDELLVGCAVDAARRRVDEPRHAGRLGGGRRGATEPSMVDLVRDRRRELTERVVRQLGHVHDRVDTLEIRRGRGAGCPCAVVSKCTVGVVLVEPARTR